MVLRGIFFSAENFVVAGTGSLLDLVAPQGGTSPNVRHRREPYLAPR